MSKFVYPYRKGSKGAKALAAAIGGKQIKLQGSRFRPGPRKTIINWGSTTLPFQEYQACNILNPPAMVKDATNKLSAFIIMREEGVPVPPFTTDRHEVDWPVTVVRHKLRGQGGDGIEIAEGDLPAAPLYVKYIKKQEEYRVHVFQGRVIFLQRKARRKEVADDDVNWKVRNLAGGFIFANQDVKAPDGVLDAARQAVAALELDFGAVDVIYNKHEGQAYVLEVNCAPGLEGTTLVKYKEAFEEA